MSNEQDQARMDLIQAVIACKRVGLPLTQEERDEKYPNRIMGWITNWVDCAYDCE